MTQTTQSKSTQPRTRLKPLHSIHLLLRGQEFAGQITSAGKTFDCRFHPLEGRITEGQLILTGSFSVIGAGGTSRTVDAVSATLAAVQAGYGTAPRAPRDYELDAPSSMAAPISDTENTGSHGYVGVLYFTLSPLDGRRLGLTYDLKKVQLNVRLAPVSDGEREMHWLLSALANSLLGESKDLTRASRFLDGVNARLKA